MLSTDSINHKFSIVGLLGSKTYHLCKKCKWLP